MAEYNSRDEIDQQYKWKLEDIYPNNEAWEQDFTKLTDLLSGIQEIERTLTDSAESLLDALVQTEQMGHISAQLFVYARMRRDEDNASSTYQAMTSRAMELNVKLSSALSFMSPALLALPEGVLEGYIKEGEQAKQEGKPLGKLCDYDFDLTELLRTKQHVLSAKEERILSMMGEVAGAPKDIFSMLNDADMKFPDIKNAKGESVPLTHGTYTLYMQSPDREVRKQAYETMYTQYQNSINTIGSTYASSVKKDVVFAQAKNFGSAIERALFSDNVPVSLYDNLVDTIHQHLPTMYRYIDVRKDVLGLDDIAMYDIYAPLVADIDQAYSYEQAMDLVRASTAVLGDDYTSLIDRSQEERWIDVYETPGKTSGAYSWGVYGVHPYVLLNHRGDLNSVFTVAHELGHAMHTYHSTKAQPQAKSGYTIFVAEVASTVNEILLTQYLLEQETDPNMRQYLLNYYLDQFRTTVLRQTMFAEFEKKAHEQVEAGTPITHQSLSDMYADLNTLYHGDEMQQDDYIRTEWARIPHFYNAFYVYKYATGFSCAVQIASDILAGKKDAVDNYIRFLSSGGSDHPLNLLQIAGVDLASGRPVEVCMQEFAKTLDTFEQALG